MGKSTKVFTIKQFDDIVTKAAQSKGDLQIAKKEGLISDEFQNLLNLAVTEVNGCTLCSYKHSKDALELGMSEDDIKMYLSGDIKNASKDETVGLMFAQHYAEEGGNYSKEAWNRVVETYGEKKAKGVLGAIKMGMFGNAFGISLGSIWSRIKLNPPTNSNFKDEISIVCKGFLSMPKAIMKI